MASPTTAFCGLCSHTERWSTKDAAGCAMSWHVYEEHPDTWHQVFGDQPPQDPRPETIGQPIR